MCIFGVYADREKRTKLVFRAIFGEGEDESMSRFRILSGEREREGRGKGCSSNLGRNRSDGACERSRHIGQGEHDS